MHSQLQAMQLRRAANRVETSMMVAPILKSHEQATQIAIVGGGLAGGLIALALRRTRPELDVMLIEAGDALGGNHRWSWFDSDLDAAGQALLAPFPKAEWHGYDVRFPAYDRQLGSTYRSLASYDFDVSLRRELGQAAVHTGCLVASLDARGVALANGTRIAASTVIDCRGPQASRHLTGGWQIFMGRHLRTPAVHGVTRPIVMDAAVAQYGPDGGAAYRFVYVLPVSADELFIEDTYYADDPVLDRALLSSRIDEYCAAHGYLGETIGTETGILPVITGGDFDAFQQEHRVKDVACAGSRGGFVHPLTSYTIPFAVETALAIAAQADLGGVALAQMLEKRADRHWRNTGFYRLLGAMLFGAASPGERYRVFERFYRLPQGLVERFYAGQSGIGDKARILIGKPPVPIGKAISALIGTGTPLVAQQEKIG